MTGWPAEFEALVRQYLPLLPADDPLLGDRRLIDLGLDSMSTVGLLVDLEQEFEVEFPDEALTAETFGTAESLWVVLAGLRDGSG
ncbi:phosphopantetheine-binding protein [Actinoalloteichus sp. AHMU CJ021]|uniref:Acyl carrier protein n=1 Tax=Actinoalloteichus caeruleus DSM 43889 TaxID=1120930 RepID=A0ABT1JET0_ACTCY|nr:MULTISPECIES: phosphopantetheine-binding protein [Actinoalloteichus]AUS82036.1 phosphopantetheine-binding protein [Actinoalloteichus sp. AHMU CJ021]MCP2330646.1 acyl carrier protein [Actinoalloteichus caeruleus DSM 43889]